MAGISKLPVSVGTMVYSNILLPTMASPALVTFSVTCGSKCSNEAGNSMLGWLINLVFPSPATRSCNLNDSLAASVCLSVWICAEKLPTPPVKLGGCGCGKGNTCTVVVSLFKLMVSVCPNEPKKPSLGSAIQT